MSAGGGRRDSPRHCERVGFGCDQRYVRRDGSAAHHAPESDRRHCPADDHGGRLLPAAAQLDSLPPGDRQY